MTKWIETTGRSEEDAIAAALFQLGLEREDVSVEVIERAKSGFLGFGSNPARVRVSYEVEEEQEEAVPVPTQEAVPVVPQQPEAEEKADQLQPEDEVLIGTETEKPEICTTTATVQTYSDEKAQRIAQFLTGLMEHLHVNAVPEISVNEMGYQVVLQGEGLGAIIGRRGETLDAIQQLTNYSVNRGQSKRVRIHIDAEGYRAKREEALQRLALKVAGKVIKYRKNMTLEPMNAYERHVIHATLQDHPNVSTYSTGVEPNRRTVVAYTPAQKS